MCVKPCIITNKVLIVIVLFTIFFGYLTDKVLIKIVNHLFVCFLIILIFCILQRKRGIVIRRIFRKEIIIFMFKLIKKFIFFSNYIIGTKL